MLISLFALLAYKIPVLFAATGADCQHSDFFGLKAWYYYLTVDNATSCNITGFDPTSTSDGFLLIVIVLIDDLLRIAGLVAIGFIIAGGFQFITSQGSPDGTAKARSTIINALIGLVIAVVAIVLVSFIGNKLQG